MTAFIKGVQREWQRICQQPSYWIALFVLPLIAFVLVFGIVATPNVTDVPMDIVDLDGSQASRDIIFRLDASASINVSKVLSSADAALERAQRKESFGYLIIPKNYHQDLIRGVQVPINTYVNQQSFMLGNVISNQVIRNLMEQSIRESVVHLMADGQVTEQAFANVYPLQLSRSVFGNSYMNYQSFLLASLLPHLWHVIVMMVTVIAVGKEFKDGTITHWYQTGNEHLSLALTSKLLIPGVVMAVWITLVDLAILHQAGVYTRSAIWSLLLASWLTQFSYHCAGLLVVAFTHNYRLSLSLAAFYTTPAFAFVGVTFPTFNMNWLSQMWQTFLPITVLIQTQNNIIHWQKSLWDAWPALTLVALFALVYGTLSMFLLRTKLTNPTYWFKH
jgi:ABC-2 type transport system permease protein